LEAYRSTYSFAQVNPQHGLECFESDEYCHLVVVNPEGEFVAYCECSTFHAEWQDSSQRIGWIDYVETRPQHRRQGLGHAILLAGLARLRERGADTAMLVTISTNTPALGLYDRTGFERVDIAEPQTYQQHIPVS
jgi:ribosomal protein S18 acetylase RimI-like enzyme